MNEEKEIKTLLKRVRTLAKELWGEEEHTGEMSESLKCPEGHTSFNNFGMYSKEEWEGIKIDYAYCKGCGSRLVLERKEIIYGNYWKTKCDEILDSLE